MAWYLALVVADAVVGAVDGVVHASEFGRR
jgi:hypothetical protein